MKKKRILGILISFALMLTMMPVLGLNQTAKATTTITKTWNSTDFTESSTTSKDGISIVGGQVLKKSREVDFCSMDKLRISNGSFTTDLGNFTSVTVTGGWRDSQGRFPGSGTGWDGDTWTGNSSTVPISGRMTDDSGEKPWTITFTIAPKEPEPTPTPTPAPTPAATSVTVNSNTVSASTLAAAVAKAGVNPDSVATVVLGKKVKKIKKGSFQNLRNADTLVVRTKSLTKARVKGALKGSSITNVKVKVGKKKTNRYYAKRYKKIFTKKNCGKKVSVSI